MIHSGIRIPAEIVRAIAAQARAEMPNEACGYLAGRREEQGPSVLRHYPMTNVDASPEHFGFDPREQFSAVKDARKDGLVMVATYHSHPSTPARMSEEDKRLANDPSIVYLIYSVEQGALKAFSVTKEREVSEVPVITA